MAGWSRPKFMKPEDRNADFLIGKATHMTFLHERKTIIVFRRMNGNSSYWLWRVDDDDCPIRYPDIYSAIEAAQAHIDYE